MNFKRLVLYQYVIFFLLKGDFEITYMIQHHLLRKDSSHSQAICNLVWSENPFKFMCYLLRIIANFNFEPLIQYLRRRVSSIILGYIISFTYHWKIWRGACLHYIEVLEGIFCKKYQSQQVSLVSVYFSQLSWFCESNRTINVLFYTNIPQISVKWYHCCSSTRMAYAIKQRNWKGFCKTANK